MKGLSERAKDQCVVMRKLGGSGECLPWAKCEIRVPEMAGNALEILQMSCFVISKVLWGKIPYSMDQVAQKGPASPHVCFPVSLL